MKKYLSLLLALLFSVGILAGCAPQNLLVNTNSTEDTGIFDSSQTSQNHTNTVNQVQTGPDGVESTSERPSFEKRYCEVTIDQDFKDDRVYVEMMPYTYPKKYTVEDFAEIGCVEILKEKTVSYRPSGITEKIPRMYYELKIAEPSKENIIKAVHILEKREDVFYVEPAYRIYTDAFPTDTEYTEGRQWGINKISLPSAWNISTGSNTVRIGIIDSGIKLNHTDLAGKVNTLLSKNYNPNFSTPFHDESGHGTHIAGIIGAAANNGGMVGVCWNIEIIVFRVSTGMINGDGSEELDYDWICEAVLDAEDLGVDILNCSFSGPGKPSGLWEIMEAFSGLIVCTAGNLNKDCDNNSYYPVGYQLNNMISVAASKETDGKWENSSYGNTTVDLFAPGENIRSCNLSGSFTYKSGTSFAAPFVTGVAALIAAVRPNLTPAGIKYHIVNNVDYVSALSPYCSADGRLNAYAALTAATTPIPHSHSYTANYISMSMAYHKSYCSCGDYLTEHHSFSTSGSVRSCTKCGYSIALNNTDPEIELQ